MERKASDGLKQPKLAVGWLNFDGPPGTGEKTVSCKSGEGGKIYRQGDPASHDPVLIVERGYVGHGQEKQPH